MDKTSIAISLIFLLALIWQVVSFNEAIKITQLEYCNSKIIEVGTIDYYRCLNLKK